MTLQRVKILDCTIRDGGHLDKWRIPLSCVKASYFAALKSGVDYFEIGYRYPATMPGLGETGYCRDSFLFELFTASESCKLTVMIDTGKSEADFFPECRPHLTPVRAVRVAAYPYELEKALHQVEELRSKGYEVFLNLMASSELTDEQLAILRCWPGKEMLQAVYFADSFGAFIPAEIPGHVERLRGLGFQRIGFHPHNNLQMAFANTLKALEEGVEYVDASIYGMGRGSGNLPVEVLVGYMEKMGETRYNTVPYLDIIERYYLDLFRELNWGYKIQSLMGGLRNIHPYYIDELFRRRIYTVDEIWNALDAIKEQCPISFSVEKLNEVLDGRFFTPLTVEKAAAVCESIGDQLGITPAQDAFRAGAAGLAGRHPGRPFLIIATGPSIVDHHGEIQKFIRDHNCVTIGINYLAENFSPDYHLFLSRKRFLKYAQYVTPGSTLLAPSFFGRELVRENFSGETIFYDLEVVEESAASLLTDETQRLSFLNVSLSAVLAAVQMGASEIYAAGIDGYLNELNKRMVYFYNEDDVPDDKDVASLRYERFAVELDRVSRFLQDLSIPFAIITPTSHRKHYRNCLA